MAANLNESVALPSDCFVPLVARKSPTVPHRRSERILSMEASKKSSENLKSISCSAPAMEMNIASMLCPQSSNNKKGKSRKRGRPRKLNPEEGGNAITQRISEGDPAVANEEPIFCPVWRGSFSTEKFGLCPGLTAHASKSATEEVRDLARRLPAQLDLQTAPVREVWPGILSISNLNIGMVDLNIFPDSGNERSVRDFDNLISGLYNEGLAMKTVVNDITILIFTSHQFPLKYWRPFGKYYLWVVFSGKNALFPGSQEENEPCRDSTFSRNAASADSSNLDKQEGNEIMKSRNAEKKMTKSSDQALGNPMIIAGTVSPSPAAGGEMIANGCLPRVLLDASPQQRTNPSEEGREGGSENQEQPTPGFPPERMVDNMTASTEGVDSETLGASVFRMFQTLGDVDLEGISSTHNSGLPFRKYYVKPSLASTLDAIIQKHGDIAKDCPLRSGETLTHVLERVCQAVKDLGDLPFDELQSSDLNSLYSTISDAELLKLNVKWLHDRYDELLEAVSGIPKYVALKADVKELQKVVKLKRTEMSKLQSEIHSLENEYEGLKKTKSSIKSKFGYFRNNSLVTGLL